MAYSTFFTQFDVDGGGWFTADEAADALTKLLKDSGVEIERSSIGTYFSGIAQAFRPATPPG